MATDSEIIEKNFNKIFDDFASFLSRNGSGDKQVAKWDMTNKYMVEVKNSKRIILRPIIAKNTERSKLVNGIKNTYGTGKKWEKVQGEIKKCFPNETLTIEQSYGLTSESTSIYTWVIDVYKEKKVRIVSIAFTCKSSTKGSKKPDPHELMTACLILRGEKVNEETLNRSKDIYGEVKSIVDQCYVESKNVVGKSGLDGFYLDNSRKDPDMVNFAKAYSASNYILSVLPKGNKNIKIYQTGQQWHNDIKKFQNSVKPKDMKNYNSSDIVISFETGSGKSKKTHFWGISLKKRGMTFTGNVDREPTLLNKPVIDLLKNYVKDISSIEEKKIIFFRGALKCKIMSLLNSDKTKKIKELLGVEPTLKIDSINLNLKEKMQELYNDHIDSMSKQELLKKCNAVFKDNDKAMMLRGQGEYKNNPNIYFKQIHKVFMKSCNKNPQFFREFLDLVFKIDMDAFLGDAVMHFSLITGTGNFDTKEQKFVSQKALEKYGKTTTEVFNEMFDGVDLTQKTINPKFLITKGTGKNAFVSGSTAAKLFYTMKIDNIYIVDLEVRYKGSLTSEPQFQVFMTTRSPNFSEEYAKKARNKSGKNRWE